MRAQAAYSRTIPVHAGRASLSYTTLAPARPATFCVEWNLTVEQRAKTIADGIAVDVAIERPSAQRASDRARSQPARVRDPDLTDPVRPKFAIQERTTGAQWIWTFRRGARRD